MKLSQDVVYYWLSMKYPVRFAVKSECAVALKRPVFYTGGDIAPNSTVIIGGEGLSPLRSAASALILCSEQPKKPLLCCSTIVFDRTVKPELIFNELQSIYDLFDEWDASLVSVCENGSAFQTLIDCSEPVLRDMLAVVDSDFHFAAYSKLTVESGFIADMSDENGNLQKESVMDFNFDPEFARLYAERGVFDYPVSSGTGVYKNIFHKGEYRARIIMPSVYDRTAFNYYAAVLNHLALYIEKFFAKNLSFYQNGRVVDRLRILLGEFLAGAKTEEDTWDYYFSEYGWQGRESLLLLQIRPGPRYDKNRYARYIGEDIEDKNKGCIYFEYEEHFLLIVNLHEYVNFEYTRMDFFQWLAYYLRDNLLTAAISRELSGVGSLKQAFCQTQAAFESGMKKNPTHWYYRFDDYALDYLLSHTPGGLEPRHVCSEKLQKLKTYDEENSTDLYRTLLCYFAAKFNATEAARKLFIHRTSFINRMEKIKDCIDLDLDSTDELLYLALSFRILESL